MYSFGPNSSDTSRCPFMSINQGETLTDLVSSGISGAVATPPSAPSRALAPSPPINESPSGPSSITIPTAQSASSSRSSTRESYFPLQPVAPASPRPAELAPLENGTELSIHDPGFEIFADMNADAGASSSTSAGVGLGVGIGTPNSRRIANTGVTDSTTMVLEPESFVPSPTPSSNRYEDQENIPPSLRSTPSNTSLRSTFTPSKSKSIPNSHPSSACSASTSTSSTGSSTWYDDDETFVLGSGRRFHGRSKLAQVIAGEVPDSGEQEDAQGGEDLTPGKMGERNKDKGKAKMAEEVDAA